MGFLKRKNREKIVKRCICNICLAIIFLLSLVLQPLKTYAIDETPQTGYCYEDLDEWVDKQQLEYSVELPFDAKISFYFVYTDAQIEIPEIGYSQQIKRESDKNTKVYETPVIPQDTKCTILIKGNNSSWWVNGKIYIIPESEIEINSVKLNYNQKKIAIGESVTLKEKHDPFFISTEDGSWKSSKPSVVYVNQKGEVTANSMGKATVSYSLYGKTSKCDISVTNMNVNMWSGGSINLTKFIKNIPGYKKGKWKLNKNKVATISQNGRLKLKNHGKTRVQFIVNSKKYNFNIYSYKGIKVYNRAYDIIFDNLKYPASYSLNDVKTEYDSLYYSAVYLTVDYSAMNSFGGYGRGYYLYIGENMKYYGEFLDND